MVLNGEGPGTATSSSASELDSESSGAAAILSPDVLTSLSLLMTKPDRLESPWAWTEHIPFAYWLIHAHRPRLLVELGTHNGASYFAFCQAVAELGLPTSCYAVDTWKGDEHSQLYGEEVYASVREHNARKYDRFSKLLRSTFDDALASFSDGSIDLLHIDGLHTYEAVRHDFESWLPKVSDRGIVLFHDIAVRERDFGVFKLWEELQQRYPSFEFSHGHGLGVLGVGRSVPSATAALLAAGTDAERSTGLRNAMWGVAGNIRLTKEKHDLAEALAAKAQIADALSQQVTALQAQTETLNAALDDAHSSKAQIANDLSLRLAEHEAKSASIAATLAGHEERTASLEAAHSETTARAKLADQLALQVSELAAQNQSVTAALSDRSAQIAALHASTSWRMTSPLRAAMSAGQLQALRLRRLRQAVPAAVRLGGGWRKTVAKAWRVHRTEGLQGVRRRLARAPAIENGFNERPISEYQNWVALYDTISDSDKQLMREQVASWANRPLISIVMPTYNTPEKFLREAIDSVREQTYDNWELCIADDASTAKHVRTTLETYRKLDPRIKVTYRSENGHISRASNSALELTSGEWVAFLDHDDRLASHAMFCVAKTINSNPEAKLIYSDEDKLDERGQRRDPYFKCDWNYTLFLGHNLITHLGVYRTDIVRDIGGFRPEYDGAQDYDLALRFVERIAPDEIHHIPHVIYSWRITSGSTALSADEKPYAMMAGERALNDHFERTAQRASAHLIGFGCRIDYQLPNPLPLVTIIIPTRNNLALLKKCIESVRSLTSYKNFEIIVVDNGSDNSACLAYLNALAAQGAAQVIRDDRHFNYSALNNAAVRRAAGDVLCLLNDDIEVISRDWLDRMVSIAMQPMVGAVGAKLLYPDDTLQHGGVVMGLGGLAAHAHHRFPRLSPGYVARAALAQEFSAVTAACLVIQKRHYDAVQGLNEVDLTVAYNDIDFCLKLKHRGLKNIWTPFAELYHHESASRGYETTPEKQARFALEGAYMKKAWPDIIAHDPAYNPNLSINTADFALAFAPRVQKPWLHSLYANNQPQPEFDPVFYRAAYADLRTFTDEQMRAHWQARGVSEGRQGSLHAVRENFVNLALSEAPILEIGPFFRPCVTGVDVFYFDVLDQEQLNERAHRIGHANARAPFIQYVSPTGDLGVVDRKFRSVISSHCIEHQPCLVRHLDQVAALLDPAGRYFLLIPDKRYCFDHFIASTTLADVLQAYEEGRTAHTLASVIEHRALTTHNDTGRHWNGDHADPNYFDSRAERTRSAIAEYNQAAGQYIDVHAWQFTPHEFRELLVSLLGLGKSRFEVERVYETPLGRNEFCAVLRRT